MKQIWNAMWRISKVLPLVGIVFVLAASAEMWRRKGYVLGTLDILLDLLPVICIIKALVEIYTGDLIPDKFDAEPGAQLETAI
jgi:hypothetical protein